MGTKELMKRGHLALKHIKLHGNKRQRTESHRTTKQIASGENIHPVHG